VGVVGLSGAAGSGLRGLGKGQCGAGGSWPRAVVGARENGGVVGSWGGREKKNWRVVLGVTGVLLSLPTKKSANENKNKKTTTKTTTR